MSSPLKVLLVGDNPNIILYAFRFNLAKNIQLYHVSANSTPDSVFDVETVNYGKDQISFANNFKSIPELQNAANATDDTPLFFDIIICSAVSLQEISSLASQLNPMINLNTKIILESSGFVQIEPFFKLSLDLPQVNVFSIITDIDFRQTDTYTYRQFQNSNSSSNNIYLGCSMTDKNNNLNSSITPSSPVFPVLDTFARLFQKLFPNDNIDILDNDSYKFLSKQWSMAIPTICYDSLLILLDNIEPLKLLDEILAKPLISGLTNELYSIISKMNITLDHDSNNENNMTNTWSSIYVNDQNRVPRLVYHFLNKTASLNLDLLLLQPILLADDHGIKTPYLEFLYSIMCQYEKFNKGTSKLFERFGSKSITNGDTETITENDNTELINRLENDNQNLVNERDQLKLMIDSNEINVNQLQLKIDTLNQQLSSTQNELAQQARNHENAINQLKTETTATTNNNNSNPAQGLKDIGAFGINYNSDNKTTPGSQSSNSTPRNIFSTLQEPTPPPEVAANTAAATKDNFYSNPENNTSTISATSTMLKEREIELRKKELELRERELEFQRKAVQQQQQILHTRQSRIGFNTSPNGNPNFQNSASPPPGNNNNFNQMPNGMNNGPNMNGQIPNGMGNGPNMNGQMNGMGNGPKMNGQMNGMNNGQMNGMNNGQMNGMNNGPNGMNNGPNGMNPKFQRASRKNRASNMPKFGGASSMNNQSLNMNMNNGNRLNSLSGGIPGQQRFGNNRPGQQGAGDMQNQQGRMGGPQGMRPVTMGGIGMGPRTMSTNSVPNASTDPSTPVRENQPPQINVSGLDNGAQLGNLNNNGQNNVNGLNSMNSQTNMNGANGMNAANGMIGQINMNGPNANGINNAQNGQANQAQNMNGQKPPIQFGGNATNPAGPTGSNAQNDNAQNDANKEEKKDEKDDKKKKKNRFRLFGKKKD